MHILRSNQETRKARTLKRQIDTILGLDEHESGHSGPTTGEKIRLEEAIMISSARAIVNANDSEAKEMLTHGYHANSWVLEAVSRNVDRSMFQKIFHLGKVTIEDVMLEEAYAMHAQFEETTIDAVLEAQQEQTL